MKFFTLVVLPGETNLSSQAALLGVVKELMWPHRDRTSVDPTDDEDEDFRSIPFAKWEGYSQTPFEMLRHYGYSVPQTASEDDMLIRPFRDLILADFQPGGCLGEPDILTLAGEWFHGPKTRELDLSNWRDKVKSILAAHRDPYGILLFCRR